MNMGTFYEEWQDYLKGEANCHNSTLASAETDANGVRSGAIEILHLQVQNLQDFPVDDFLSIAFTLHRTILEKIKNVDERLCDSQLQQSYGCSNIYACRRYASQSSADLARY